jgi:Flp pilus assembly protein RcpC/CpaB/SAF domain
MRIRRTSYIVVFLVAGVIAAGAFVFAQPRTEIVRAKVDVPVLTQITADMVETIRLSPADAPADAARSLDEVVGQYAALPILAGQDVDRRALERTPGERSLGFGAPLAAGQVAFALPVDPSQAVGAALAPGARVDVIAVPNTLKTGVNAGAGASLPAPVMLGQGYVILALRTADGQTLTSGTTTDSSGTRPLVAPKLGSVVIAIPAEREAEFAGAALSSTFYLTLAQPATSP